MAQGVPTAGSGGLIPPEVLARVPEYSGAARIAALTGGTVNRSFIVETPAGRYFLRLHEPVSVVLGADHAREARLHSAAADAGLAPPLIYADPEHRFVITEFLDGRVWTPEDFAEERQLRKLGLLLHRVHEVLPPIAAPFDLSALLEGFISRIAGAAPQERPQLECLAQRAGETLRGVGSDTRERTLFHSDPHHSNLIERADGRLLLVDWEYAAVGDPLYDLACVLAYYPAALPHAQSVLEAAGLSGRATRGMLDQASWLYLLLGYLWYRARRLEGPAGEADLQVERSMKMRLG